MAAFGFPGGSSSSPTTGFLYGGAQYGQRQAAPQFNSIGSGLGQPQQAGFPTQAAGNQFSNPMSGNVIGQGGFYDPNAGMGDAQNSAIGATNQFLPGVGSGASPMTNPVGMGQQAAGTAMGYRMRMPWWQGNLSQYGGGRTQNYGLDPRVAQAMQVRQGAAGGNFLR